MISRASNSPFRDWWWTVDRLLLGLVLVLVAFGLVMSLSASPSVADTINVGPYHFVIRHMVFAPVAVALMLALSTLSPGGVRRVALVLLLGALALMVLVLFIGPEVKGSRRWIALGSFSLQPSEFLKPAFIVISAWLFAEGRERRDIPGSLMATGLLGLAVGLLVAEPDFGQTVLVATVWGVMFFLAGVSMIVIGGAVLVGVGGAVAAYFSVHHFRSRIDRFLDPASGDTFQVDTALRAFDRGGFLGVGPGEGLAKRVLPDAHTDFVFAVVGEEFGILACLIVVALFATIVVRALFRARLRQSAFEQFAIAGLAAQLGTQAFINMGVNLHLLPAKGMTLPFFSYGGSAMLGIGVTTGFLLALSKRAPQGRIAVRPFGAALQPA